MRARILFFLVLIFLCGFRCTLPWARREPGDLTIVSYNVHNLFDDVDDGGEYPEFTLDSGKWNAELYEKRLTNAATAICSFFPESGATPDIICLQEVESQKALEDLAAGPLKKGGYRWIAFGGPASSAVKCGIVSRRPIAAFRTHSLVDAWGFGPGRDILEASFDLGEDGSGAEAKLTIFVCHWKSRREGEEATEVARRWASGLVSARIAELASTDPERSFLVCGDFNESPDEFRRAGRRYPTALMPDPREFPGGSGEEEAEVPAAWFEEVLRVSGAASGACVEGSEVTLYSPWTGAEGFSYVFDGEGERLDGFLLGPGFADGAGLEFIGFSASGDPSLLGDDGEPLAWTGSSGFSDHLPIALTIAGAGNR